MKLNKSQIKQIERFAYNHYKKLDQTHGIEHMIRTVRLATYLSKKERADIQIVKLGAMLHQFHNAEVVRRFLKKIKVDKETAEQIVHCVDCSRNSTIHKARTIEAKIVFDADKLQVVGPFGIIREISCCVVAPRNMKFREALEHAKMIEKKCFNKLQTRTARNLTKKPHEYVVKFWKILDEWDKVEL